MRAYLLNSEDPTDTFLKTALAKVCETAALWEVAKGNSTSSYSEIGFGAQACAVLKAFLVSLSQSPGKANIEEIPYCLRLSVGGSRLEKVVKEVGQRDSAKQSKATASSGGQVIVS
jgi:hypothetical protein